MCGGIGELIIAKPIPIGICANSSSKPVSESSTTCLHELVILTGRNELQAAYKLQNTLALYYLPFIFCNVPRDLMSECVVGKC